MLQHSHYCYLIVLVNLLVKYLLFVYQIVSFNNFSIISVKAKSFADREIRYTLKAQGQGAGTFNIGPTSGIVKLAKELDFEDLRQPHVYSLVVTATEDSGGFSTSVEVRDTKLSYILIYAHAFCQRGRQRYQTAICYGNGTSLALYLYPSILLVGFGYSLSGFSLIHSQSQIKQ